MFNLKQKRKIQNKHSATTQLHLAAGHLSSAPILLRPFVLIPTAVLLTLTVTPPRLRHHSAVGQLIALRSLAVADCR